MHWWMNRLQIGQRSICAALGLTAVVGSAVAEPVEITDMLGNQVVLKQPAQQSVTIPMPASAMLLSLAGDAKRLVGMNPNSHDYMQKGMLARIFPDVAHIRSDVTRAGFAPNVETLLQMQPDLIWQWGHLGDELITPLRSAGLPVAALLYGTEERVKDWITLMGQSLGREAQASAQLQWRSEVEQAIRQVTDGIAPEDRPRVMHLSRYFPSYQVAGSSGNFHWDIQLAGGRNVAASIGNANTVNVEQILAWNPEVILLNNFEDKLTPETIYQDPLLAQVDAVRERRVYKIPAGGYRWDPPNQESPLYWQWLSVILHPEKFDWNLRELIKQRYQAMYGYAATDADVDFVLHTNMNASARHYERFAR